MELISVWMLLVEKLTLGCTGRLKVNLLGKMIKFS